LTNAVRFSTRKRRQAPTVIIVSLIDVLIVVLIFLMVTTTFKQQPAVKIALPSSIQPKGGASDTALVVTIPKQGPLYLKTDPITMDTLQQRLVEAVHPRRHGHAGGDLDQSHGRRQSCEHQGGERFHPRRQVDPAKAR
jgi:biopolymer transport protein ExbD